MILRCIHRHRFFNSSNESTMFRFFLLLLLSLCCALLAQVDRLDYIIKYCRVGKTTCGR